MYRYETHMHTSPASGCAKRSVRENVEFYRSMNYDGIFITNHFLDGNFYLRKDESLSYEDKVRAYCADYEEAVAIGKEVGLKVFFGVEITYGGTDFLIYGLDKEWYLAHPEIMEIKKSEELPFMMSEGALVIQAHPFRESGYIDHIRLYPRQVHGVEIINSNRKPLENEMACIYCEKYNLVPFAGTDNHVAENQIHMAGLECETPIRDVSDFIERVKSGKMHIFTIDRTEELENISDNH